MVAAALDEARADGVREGRAAEQDAANALRLKVAGNFGLGLVEIERQGGADYARSLLKMQAEAEKRGAERERWGQADPLAFAELRAVNVRRCEAAFHPISAWSPTDWACAFAGEAGEACNEVKKLRRLDGADQDLDTPNERARLSEKIGKELADTIIYADLLAARLGIDLGGAVRAKFNEVSGRRGCTITLARGPMRGPEEE